MSSQNTGDKSREKSGAVHHEKQAAEFERENEVRVDSKGRMSLRLKKKPLNAK